MKWPTYWQYLDRLTTTRFVVCLRHPVEVVASFARQRGRLSQGLQYDVPFNRDLNAELAAATDDPCERRALLYAHVHSRILPDLSRPNVFVLRYERWFQDPERLSGRAEPVSGRAPASGVRAHHPAHGAGGAPRGGSPGSAAALRLGRGALRVRPGRGLHRCGMSARRGPPR